MTTPPDIQHRRIHADGQRNRCRSALVSRRFLSVGGRSCDNTPRPLLAVTVPIAAWRQLGGSPQEKYGIWTQLVRGETTIAEAAERFRVDRSTIAKLREVAKAGAGSFSAS